MVLAPWVKGDWNYVQDVWDRWQTFNAGILAFAASLIAFKISRYNAKKQRQRQFIAARAFLPHALSELTYYNKRNSKLLFEAWDILTPTGGFGEKPLTSELAGLPDSYKEVFWKCISEADPEVADYLAKILVRLQINHSRMTELHSLFGQDRQRIWVKNNIMNYMFSLGELQAMINRIFGYSRGLDPFDDSSLVWGDYRAAYDNLNIDIDYIDELEEFTLRAIARNA